MKNNRGYNITVDEAIAGDKVLAWLIIGVNVLFPGK